MTNVPQVPGITGVGEMNLRDVPDRWKSNFDKRLAGSWIYNHERDEPAGRSQPLEEQLSTNVPQVPGITCVGEKNLRDVPDRWKSNY